MPRHRSRSLATDATSLAVAVPQVVAHRLARLALAGPNPSARDRREFRLMFDEKAMAFQRSWMAMTTTAWSSGFTLWMSLARAWSGAWLRGSSMTLPWPAIHAAGLDVLAAGLRPVSRTAGANAKRLNRRGARRRA